MRTVDTDPNILAHRARAWRIWLAAPRHQRSQLDFDPVCFSCGAPPIGEYNDRSPRFGNCHGQKGIDS